MSRHFEVRSLSADSGELLGVVARHSTREDAERQVAALERLQLLTAHAGIYPVRYAVAEIDRSAAP